MSATAQLDIGALLEMAGARIRGRDRADCPDCKRPRAVSFNETAFCCHGIDCDFHGGIGTLRQRLGIEREWLPKAEWIRQCRQRESVHDAAQRLYAAAKARRFALYDELRSLARIEAEAHRAGPSEVAWGALAMVYSGRPGIEADLERLESGDLHTVLECLGEEEA